MGATLLSFEDELKIRAQLTKIRGYSKATAGGGAIVKSTKGGGGTTRSTTEGGGTTRSTSSGGGSQQTSSSGGGTSTSTQSGGGSSRTTSTKAFNQLTMTSGVPVNAVGSENYGYHQHHVTVGGGFWDHNHSVTVPSHSHNFSTPNHTHTVSTPSHTHDVTIPNHSHSVSIPSHTHEIEIPDHTHAVAHEIVELSSIPNRVTIKVDGNVVPHTSTSGDRINLVDYMSKDSNGKIARGRHEVEILPSGLARIEADLICRVFIQSQLGGNF